MTLILLLFAIDCGQTDLFPVIIILPVALQIVVDCHESRDDFLSSAFVCSEDSTPAELVIV